MPEAFRLQQLLVDDESSFCENASFSADAKIPALSASVTLNQDRIADDGIRERLAVTNKANIGPRTATLNFQTYWIGHQTTAEGSLTATWQHNLLADGLGGGNTAGVGGNAAVGSSGLSATSIGTDHAATIAEGQIIRVGDKGDGRGDGCPTVVASQGTAGDLLTALPAAPQTADDVYACLIQYHDESAVTSLTSKRFMFMHATTGAQYILRGCQLASVSLNMPQDGSLPTIDWTYECAYWERSATSFPNTGTTIGTHEAAPVAGGSCFINDVGTATRATITPAELSLTVDMGLSPVIGPGGSYDEQYITDYVRTNMKTTLELAIPWVTTYETWWDTDNSSIAGKHILYACNHVDGRSVGFYLPRCWPMGNRPSGVDNVNDQNYVRIMFAADEGPSTTNEMTRSAVRFFAG